MLTELTGTSWKCNVIFHVIQCSSAVVSFFIAISMNELNVICFIACFALVWFAVSISISVLHFLFFSFFSPLFSLVGNHHRVKHTNNKHTNAQSHIQMIWFWFSFTFATHFRLSAVFLFVSILYLQWIFQPHLHSFTVDCWRWNKTEVHLVTLDEDRVLVSSLVYNSQWVRIPSVNISRSVCHCWYYNTKAKERASTTCFHCWICTVFPHI